MKKTRVEIKMTFSADLDPIRGWGHHPDDWCTMLEQRIGATSDSPYNLKLIITDINCREEPSGVALGPAPAMSLPTGNYSDQDDPRTNPHPR